MAPPELRRDPQIFRICQRERHCLCRGWCCRTWGAGVRSQDRCPELCKGVGPGSRLRTSRTGWGSLFFIPHHPAEQRELSTWQVNGLLGSGVARKVSKPGLRFHSSLLSFQWALDPPNRCKATELSRRLTGPASFQCIFRALAAHGFLSWLASDIKCGRRPLPTSIHHVCLYACLPQAALWYWVWVATPSSLLTTQCQTTARLSANLEPPALPCPVESSRVIQRVSLFGVFCGFFFSFFKWEFCHSGILIGS